MKVGMAYVGIHVSRQLKLELAWATDKQLWVVYKTVHFTIKELKNKPF